MNNTSQQQEKTPRENTSHAPLLPQQPDFLKPSIIAPQNSREFSDIPSNSTTQQTQVPDQESSNRKPLLGTFAGKLTPQQHSQLIEWLSDHTYDEVVELVAEEPPQGFGIKVGKTTICRFYKANFDQISNYRRTTIEMRSCQVLNVPDSVDYRCILRNSYSHLLLERFWELVSHPVQSADELKKLVTIAEKLKSLDRDKDQIEEILEERRQAEMNQILAAISKPHPTGPRNA
jgi:hypothetical protein